MGRVKGEGSVLGEGSSAQMLPLLNSSYNANQSFAIPFVERKVRSGLKIGQMVYQSGNETDSRIHIKQKSYG